MYCTVLGTHGVMHYFSNSSAPTGMLLVSPREELAPFLEELVWSYGKRKTADS